MNGKHLSKELKIFEATGEMIETYQPQLPRNQSVLKITERLHIHNLCFSRLF